jgi:type II restriction/modification system DNA methylase subunit YeeA
METSKLKKFAQFARRSLIDQVSGKMQQVLAEDSAARREEPKAVEDLATQIKAHGRDQVIETVAYTWFNRFCALRFMDVNRYTRIGVVSPAEGQFQPEILAEAKMGHIDKDIAPEKTRQQIFGLLNGATPSRDPQAEAYRLLVVAACNDYNKAMDYLFEYIADYTELLMPDDLLSGNSILAYTREAMTPDACQDVEVIGWLYQFYISEKKDEVFNGLKKNKKITPENIPAATQLFTPHWIVRYLVENSLGRLWMLNRPNSRLAEKMDYYIKPETPETDFLKIGKPEEIKVCDPAAGSGHMLTYSFDILYSIYEEEGYESTEIPRLILENNLFGIEIDKRAGELAAFALTMKARAKQRRFFSKKVAPNICVLENIHFDEGKLLDYIDFAGRDLFTTPLQITLRQFEEADNFGSLIRPKETNVNSVLKILEGKNVSDQSGQFLQSMIHKKVLQALRQADYLNPKYHVVITNPPYMGGKGMNGRLSVWLKDNYPDVKSDLFSAFIVRNTEMALPKGQLGFMSPFVWMFISSYEKLRSFLINKKTITSLVQLEYSGFDGATVPICTFTVENAHRPDFKGGYVRLSDFRGSENQAPKTLEAINNSDCGWFHRASAADFKKIPGSPIAYWISDSMRDLFENLPSINESLIVTGGMTTADNERFLRLWHELPEATAYKHCENRDEAINSRKKWFPYNKGGNYRKWFGNREYHVNWYNDGEEIISTGRAFPISKEYYFRESLTYTATSSSYFGIRYSDPGFLFDAKGSSCFADTRTLHTGLGFLTSKIATYLLKCVNPTIEFQTANISILPFQPNCNVEGIVPSLIRLGREDWNAYETSWGLTELPLLSEKLRVESEKQQQINPSTSHFPLNTRIADVYASLRAHWQDMTLEMQRLEEENNRIFIEAYGMQEELTPEVPLKEITLTCNPHYRYGVNYCEVGSEKWEAMEARLLEDTMKEFISYSVGCMFGRYSLDMPGLVLANQGETVEDYIKKLEEWKNQAGTISQTDITFHPNKDNVIPVLNGDWFTDEIVERFQRFLHVTFGDEYYEANLKFIEKALGKDIRRYFLKDFYNDHVRRYKKRPIYWLFSSPKGSFNALIYMHRYRSDTVSVVLNDYLREFRTKLISRKNHLEAVSISANASQGEKTKALKEIESLKKIINELDAYERDVMYPLATEQLEIDLDDGVKVNYLKFGAALKKIPGLDAKGEE